MEKDAIALVQFNERVIDGFNEPYYTQQLKLLVEEIGMKYSTIVLRVLQTKVECIKIWSTFACRSTHITLLDTQINYLQFQCSRKV